MAPDLHPVGTHAVDLDDLFARLRAYEARAFRHAMDPRLPRRVHASIARGSRRLGSRRLGFRRLGARIAATLVLALLVAHLGGRVRRHVPAADAGPLEARRLYEQARRTKHAPWPTAVTAYRAALGEAGRADSVRPRAYRAIAGIYEDAGLPHAAQAARHCASRASRRSDSLASYRLACARSLLSEGDLEAGNGILEALVKEGRNRAPEEHTKALALLADYANDRADLAHLARLLRTMDDGRAPLPLRIKTRSRLGLLHLRAGARLRAVKLLEEARRLFARSQDEADDAVARKAAKLWLDLPLRKALPK